MRPEMPVVGVVRTFVLLTPGVFNWILDHMAHNAGCPAPDELKRRQGITRAEVSISAPRSVPQQNPSSGGKGQRN